MGLLSMMPGLLNMKRPSFVILFVTARCNARCSFCFYGDNVRDASLSEELTAEEYSLISKSAGKVPYLLLSGGEPVLRDDLADIIGYFVENASSRFVTVPSNGLSPERTRTLFESLTSRYPQTHFRASFSVDYADDRHDELRGVKGCLESLKYSAGLISDLRERRDNLSMDVVTVFMGQSAHDLGEVRDFALRELKPNNHELHLLRPDGPGGAPDGIDVDLFLRELHIFGERARSSETRRLSSLFRGINNTFLSAMPRLCRGAWIAPCRAGTKFTVVDELGNVRLCEIRDEVLGNLRDCGYDLISLLRSVDARRTVREMNREKCTCTWECAMSTNVIYSPRFLPGILLRTILELFTRRSPQ